MQPQPFFSRVIRSDIFFSLFVVLFGIHPQTLTTRTGHNISASADPPLEDVYPTVPFFILILNFVCSISSHIRSISHSYDFLPLIQV
ncbi:hypothetical protein Hanom_Chr14g01298491 [Helianthus anomalus]